MSPINNMSLDDLNFFLDPRLSVYNVYQFTFVTPDIDDVLADIIQYSQKYSSNQMIQSVGVDFAKVTFVAHTDCKCFYNLISRLIDRIAKLHKCSIVIY